MRGRDFRPLPLFLCSLNWQMVEVCCFCQQVIHLLGTKYQSQMFDDVLFLLLRSLYIKDAYRNSQFFTDMHVAFYFCMLLIFFFFCLFSNFYWNKYILTNNWWHCKIIGDQSWNIEQQYADLESNFLCSGFCFFFSYVPICWKNMW